EVGRAGWERGGVAGVRPDGMGGGVDDRQAAVVAVEARLSAVGRHELGRHDLECVRRVAATTAGEGVVGDLSLDTGLAGCEATLRGGVLVGDPAGAVVAHADVIVSVVSGALLASSSGTGRGVDGREVVICSAVRI